MKDNNFQITIFGDICPVADTLKGFESGLPQAIMSESLLRLVAESDLTVGNLECAITDGPAPIKKAGPVLFASSKCLKTLAKAGFKALSLANNHIRDCGSDGVDSTIKVCKENGITPFGAGADEAQAKRPFIAEIKGKRIAFVSFAEHEFNAVSQAGSGAALLDVYEDFDRLRALRTNVDFLVVLYHGGIEYHRYPSPLLQKRCRAFARAGADLVLCQHSHCIGSFERNAHSTILYGQGNSLFGYRPGNDSWNTGLLVSVEHCGGRFTVNFLPCRTEPDSVFGLLSDNNAKIVIDALNHRSDLIYDYDFIEKEWINFCTKNENLNLALLYGWNRYLIFLNRKLCGWPLRMVYGLRKRNITHNLIRCEAHNEVIQTILKKYDF